MQLETTKPTASRYQLHRSLLCKLLLAMTLFAVVFNNIMLGLVTRGDTFLSEDEVVASDLQAEGYAFTPKSKFVPLVDRFHLSLLHAACLNNREAIITWKFGVDGEENTEVLIQRNDPRVLEELRQCPDVDIYLPVGIRGNGYCEDGCAYAKYLNSRLLPGWVFEDRFFDANLNKTTSYHELCPNTPLLFMNHYWDGRHEAKDWPKEKPIYVMPNIEMGQLRESAYWRADAILCKTRGCFDRMTQWYAQEGNPRQTAVFYTRHTTSDIASYTRHILGEDIRPKNFSSVRFTHTAGSSVHKGTPTIVQCWLSRPDLPPLDLYMGQGLYDFIYRDNYGKQLNASKNINLVRKGFDNLQFGRIIAESAFFLCPSSMEGYGHYINHARSSGGVIITTNAHPMNELIPVPDGGIFVKTERATHPHMILGGGFEGEHGLRGFEDNGLVAGVKSNDLCAAVDQVLLMSVSARKKMAEVAQLQYHEDTKVFAKQMRELRAYARNQIKLNASDALTGILGVSDDKHHTHLRLGVEST